MQAGSDLIDTLNRRIRRSLSGLGSLRTWFLWYKRERKFLKFLGKIKADSSSSDNCGQILIVIQPWLLTPLPWFLIALACAFHSCGKKASIVWDDTDTDFIVGNWQQRLQQRSIQRVIKRIPKFIRFMRLSNYSGSEIRLQPSLDLHRLLRKNTTIRCRGEVYPQEIDEFARTVLNNLKKTAWHIKCFLDNFRPVYIIVGGGGYGASGLWFDLAGSMNIRVASIDSGFSILLLSTAGIAANLSDIERAFKLLAEEDNAWIIAEAKAELNQRMHGADQFASQIAKPIGGCAEFGVLLPLNQSYDLSALERHRVFENQTEWMLETIAWVLKNSTEKIVVRRHPVERLPQFKSNDDYLKCIKERFGDNERIVFVNSDDAINTYDLIMSAKVVVPYISTVGIESAALGRVVVTEGDSCYAGLGFVWSARNREEYFKYLDSALKGCLKVNEQQMTDAWRCYYLTQCCNWHRTFFTPQATDFDRWVLDHPEELFSQQEVLDVLDALDSNVPLSIIKHLRHKKERARDDD